MPFGLMAPKSVTYYNSPNFFARSKIILTDDGSHLLRPLGSRLIDIQSQKRTVAASATAERNTFGHLSYRVAILRQSFSRPNMISIRLRRL